MVDFLPQDSLVNEINNSISDYDVLMGEASSKWGQSRGDLEDLMKRIAYHESKGISGASQLGGGPGRGLYQFETGKGGAGETAANRLVHELGYTPDWLNITEEGLDASSLNPEQQNMLFLANYMQKPSEGSSMRDVGPDNLGEWWAREHWAGPDSLKQERLGSFGESMKDYSKLQY